MILLPGCSAHSPNVPASQRAGADARSRRDRSAPGERKVSERRSRATSVGPGLAAPRLQNSSLGRAALERGRGARASAIIARGLATAAPAGRRSLGPGTRALSSGLGSGGWGRRGGGGSPQLRPEWPRSSVAACLAGELSLPNGKCAAAVDGLRLVLMSGGSQKGDPRGMQPARRLSPRW